MLSVGGNDAAAPMAAYNPTDQLPILRTAREENNQTGYDDAQSETQFSTSGAISARGTVHTGHGFY